MQKTTATSLDASGSLSPTIQTVSRSLPYQFSTPATQDLSSKKTTISKEETPSEVSSRPTLKTQIKQLQKTHQPSYSPDRTFRFHTGVPGKSLHPSVLYRLITDKMKQLYCQHNCVEAVRTISPTEYKIQLSESASRFARQSIVIGPIDNRNWMFSPIEEAQPSVVIAGVSQDLPIDFILQEIRQYNNWPYGKDPEENITQLTRLSRKCPDSGQYTESRSLRLELSSEFQAYILTKGQLMIGGQCAVIRSYHPPRQKQQTESGTNSVKSE